MGTDKGEICFIQECTMNRGGERKKKEDLNGILEALELLVLVLLLLLTRTIDTGDDGVIALVGLKWELLDGLELLLLELLANSEENGGGSDGGVDARCLDGNEEVAAVLEEGSGVDGEDLGLCALGNVSEENVDHGDEHAVLGGVARILNDGNDVGALLSDLNQLATGASGHLDGVDGTLGTNNVGNVRDSGSGSGTKVENLGSGRNVEVLDS